MSTSAYSVSHLSVVRSSSTLLRDVSFDLPQGALISILGPNGAGKSTLLNVLARDLTPTSGSVKLLDRDLSSWSIRELAHTRALFPQQTLLQFAFRARDVVAMGRLPDASTGQDEDDLAVDAAMQRVEITQLAERIYPQLSGGEQSRTSFARILVQETPIVLLDEPTASLDIRHQHQVMSIAQELVAAGGTVISIEHDINLALAYADHIVLMDGGELIATGTPWEIASGDVLQRTFRYPLTVIPHPLRDCPLVLGGENG